MNTASFHHRDPAQVANAGKRPASRLTASQRYDYYLVLAHEQARAGDRVQAENYYQHAEHFYRAAHSTHSQKATSQQ